MLPSLPFQNDRQPRCLAVLIVPNRDRSSLPFGLGRGVAGRLDSAFIRGKKERFGRGTNVAQPEMGGFTCSQCGARYNSERELNEHMTAAHHKADPEHSSSQRAHTQKDDSKIPSRETQKTSKS